MPRLLLPLAAVVALFSSPLAAQSIRDSLPGLDSADSGGVLTDSLIRTGRFVRARLADGGRVWGVVREVRGDTLVLGERLASGLEQRVTAGSLRSLEVRRNPSANSASVRTGMVLGMLAGGVGYVAWCNKNRVACARDAQGDPYQRCCCNQQDDNRYAIGSFFITAGTLLGGAIGYALTPPTWRRVGVSIGAGVTPGADGEATASVGARIPLAALGR